jgi:hypothetical protein
MSVTELQQAEKRLSEMVNRRAEAEELHLREERAERMRAERAQAREDAERRRQFQVRYADAYQSFGVDPPAPVDDETPLAFRKRLFDGLTHKLPSGHEWSGVRADDIPASAAPNIEAMVINAAIAEGAAPSPENLSRDGSMVTRIRVDPDRLRH